MSLENLEPTENVRTYCLVCGTKVKVSIEQRGDDLFCPQCSHPIQNPWPEVPSKSRIAENQTQADSHSMSSAMSIVGGLGVVLYTLSGIFLLIRPDGRAWIAVGLVAIILLLVALHRQIINFTIAVIHRWEKDRGDAKKLQAQNERLRLLQESPMRRIQESGERNTLKHGNASSQYQTLRILASIYRAMAIAVFIFVLAILVYRLRLQNEIDIENIAVAFAMLIAAASWMVVSLSIAEGIECFVAIEANGRRTVHLLEKLLSEKSSNVQ